MSTLSAADRRRLLHFDSSDEDDEPPVKPRAPIPAAFRAARTTDGLSSTKADGRLISRGADAVARSEKDISATRSHAKAAAPVAQAGGEENHSPEPLQRAARDRGLGQRKQPLAPRRIDSECSSSVPSKAPALIVKMDASPVERRDSSGETPTPPRSAPTLARELEATEARLTEMIRLREASVAEAASLRVQLEQARTRMLEAHAQSVRQMQREALTALEQHEERAEAAERRLAKASIELEALHGQLSDAARTLAQERAAREAAQSAHEAECEALALAHAAALRGLSERSLEEQRALLEEQRAAISAQLELAESEAALQASMASRLSAEAEEVGRRLCETTSERDAAIHRREQLEEEVGAATARTQLARAASESLREALDTARAQLAEGTAQLQATEVELRANREALDTAS